jgi:hypothetical protein
MAWCVARFANGSRVDTGARGDTVVLRDIIQQAVVQVTATVEHRIALVHNHIVTSCRL